MKLDGIDIIGILTIICISVLLGYAMYCGHEYEMVKLKQNVEIKK